MSELDIVTAEADRMKDEVKSGKTSIAQLHAGAVSRELVAAIAQVISPQRIAEAINEMLSAKRELKNGTILPDTRAQEAGVKFYLQYMIGLPVQRVEQVNVNIDADAEAGLTDRLTNSPALRQSLKRAIEKAEGVVEA